LDYGNSVLVTACNTETRPSPADVAINGHGRSRTGAVVWIADSDPPFRILVRLLRDAQFVSRTDVVVWIADSDPPIDPCGAVLVLSNYWQRTVFRVIWDHGI